MSLFVGDKTKQPRPLNVNAAIDLGAELASEGFLLAIAVALLVLEYNRGAKKDKQKEENLQNKFRHMESRLELQQVEINDLKKLLSEIPQKTKPENVAAPA